MEQLQSLFDLFSFSQNVQDGIKAGLTVLLLDVLFVVVAIGAAFKWFEEWKWRHTRQELATALLVSAVQVSHSTKLNCPGFTGETFV